MNDTVNKSRRGVIKAGLMLATAGAAVAGTARAQDQKIEQSLVQYQQTPKDGAECDKCVNWLPPNACKIVAGTINPKGWCVAYAPAGG
jgi:hypothetical protein